jgi:hypothetical protein
VPSGGEDDVAGVALHLEQEVPPEVAAGLHVADERCDAGDAFGLGDLLGQPPEPDAELPDQPLSLAGAPRMDQLGGLALELCVIVVLGLPGRWP